MEKYINFEMLREVGTGTGDAPTGVQLKDATATFTQFVRPNAIVWDQSTNSASGGQMYIVTAVTSDTELALQAIGPTASQGTGVPAAALYNIYMPEFTKVKNGYGTADGTAANKLILSTATFILDGVEVGDVVFDITGGAQTTVTALDSNTQLSVADDIFVGGDNFLIMKDKADKYSRLVNVTNRLSIENNTNATNNARINMYRNTPGTILVKDVISYAYSDTGAVAASDVCFDMVEAISDLIEKANQENWCEVVYDFPAVTNRSSTTPNTTNTTFLGGKEFFILDVAKA